MAVYSYSGDERVVKPLLAVTSYAFVHCNNVNNMFLFLTLEPYATPVVPLVTLIVILEELFFPHRLNRAPQSCLLLWLLTIGCSGTPCTFV